MNPLFWGTRGPADAEIVIVGEAWGREEQTAEQPFVGSSGNELIRMLAEAGIDHSRVLMTNIVADRPEGNKMWKFFDKAKTFRGLGPKQIILNGLNRLNEQIAAHPRKLVIGCGNYPLWALTKSAKAVRCPEKEADGIMTPTGIGNWRGSMWYCDGGQPEIQAIKYLPIIHPAAILRQWSLRSITVHDLKARVPLALSDDWRPDPLPEFWAPPTFPQAVGKLLSWIGRANSGECVRLAGDIETIPKYKLIVCIGFADSDRFAMCIPFLNILRPGEIIDYWSHGEEVILIKLLRRILSHPNVKLEGQNFNYDNQYIRKDWAITPLVDFDTMAAQHILWPGTDKGLDTISSLYCKYHWYWKEDGKDWDEKADLKSQLVYNCWDCVRTFEAATDMRKVLIQVNQQRQWEEMRDRHWFALYMMNKGVAVDRKKRATLGLSMQEIAGRLSHELEIIIPDWMLPEAKKGAKKTAWYNSPLQQKWVFEHILGCKIPVSRKTGRPTLDKNALLDLGRKYPIWKGLFKRIGSLRSVEVFQSHFIGATLTSSNRASCMFKCDGTETMRFSSAQNAMGEGMNLQTIPAGDED